MKGILLSWSRIRKWDLIVLWCPCTPELITCSSSSTLFHPFLALAFFFKPAANTSKLTPALETYLTEQNILGTWTLKPPGTTHSSQAVVVASQAVSIEWYGEIGDTASQAAEC